VIEHINEQAKLCSCGNHKAIQMAYHSQPGALLELPKYLSDKHMRKVLLVVDEHTWSAAGKSAAHAIGSAGIQYSVCSLTPNMQGDVIADEHTIVEILLHTDAQTDCIIAVGSGTIHDMVRFVCFKLNKAFISVPTAASVDGFTSVGAPIIVRGAKKTIPAIYPQALFVDPQILANAPKEMTAAGFGDMIGKYTSLADWIFSRDMAGEPFCPLAYELTEQALSSCVKQANEIAEGTEQGIQQLFDSLTLSGLAILLSGHSRSASGAEHHLSHFWEMNYIKNNKPQLLHGAKVGVAAIIISTLYKALHQLENNPHPTAFAELPGPKEISKLISSVGGAVTPAEIGISSALVEEALMKAYHLRDRFTGLRWIHEQGRHDLITEVIKQF
jgi:glycerol-1-phosphate dehydrogenase [NAD(P)+]